MRTIKQVLSGLGILGSALVIGCNGSSPTELEIEAVGSSDAKIVLAVAGSARADLHLTAIDDVTSAVMIDRVVDVTEDAPAMIDLSLDTSSYTLHLEAFSAGEHPRLLSRGDAHVGLKANVTTEIFLTAHADGAGSNVPGDVSVSVADAPYIRGVTVTHSAASVTIKVNVTGSGDGDLSYFWAGYGISSAMQGTSSLTISASEAAAAGFDIHAPGASAHFIAQSREGATSSIAVDLGTRANGNACVFCNGGSSSVSGDPISGAGSIAPQRCLDERVQCNVVCKAELADDMVSVDATAACLLGCGRELAMCESGHVDISGKTNSGH